MNFQHYSDRRPIWDELGDFSRLTGLLALLDIAIVATAQWNASRLWWVVSWAMVLIGLVFGRMLTRATLRHWGLWERPTIIIGIGPNAADAAQALDDLSTALRKMAHRVQSGDADGLREMAARDAIPEALHPVAAYLAARIEFLEFCGA
jgi:undecaprenyl-phosphate galactose phosphotransferase